MANVLVIVPGITSIVNANLELARRLVVAGHSVLMASSANVGHQVRAQGLPFLQFEKGRPVQRKAHTDRFGARLWRWILRWRMRKSRCQEKIDASGLRTLAEQLGPHAFDLILVDIESAEHVIASWQFAGRVALVSTFLSIWKSPCQPPLHRDITPGVGWRGSRLGIEFAWLQLWLEKWWYRTRSWIRASGADRESVLLTFARQQGFPFDRYVERYDYLLPFSYRELPILTLNALELDFPLDLPAQCRYVGPMINSGSRQGDKELASEIQVVLERAGRKPLIYCGFGAFHRYDVEFIRRVAEVGELQPDWELVVTLGGNIEPEAVGVVPDNVHVFNWVPQLKLLSVAQCAVIHAGMISINECLWCGVPMLFYPIRGDQLGNAARLSAHGLGITGDRRRDRSQDMAARIAGLIQDPGMSGRMDRIRRTLAAYEQNSVLESAVAELLRD